MNNFNPVVVTLFLICCLLGGLALGYFGSDIIEHWLDPEGSISLEDGKVSYPLPPSADTVVIARNMDVQWSLNDVITLAVPQGNSPLEPLILVGSNGYEFIDVNNDLPGTGLSTTTRASMCFIPKNGTYDLVYTGMDTWEINKVQ